MKLFTSINRTAPAYALASWRRRGFAVTSFHTPGDWTPPGVDIVRVPRPAGGPPPITDLLERVTEPTLILNADIELVAPAPFWDELAAIAATGVMPLVVRHNWGEDRAQAARDAYGFDGFVVTPGLRMPPIFRMGVPWWDWALPCFHGGPFLQFTAPIALHRNHADRAWNTAETQMKMALAVLDMPQVVGRVSLEELRQGGFPMGVREWIENRSQYVEWEAAA